MYEYTPSQTPELKKQIKFLKWLNCFSAATFVAQAFAV